MQAGCVTGMVAEGLGFRVLNKFCAHFPPFTLAIFRSSPGRGFTWVPDLATGTTGMGDAAGTP